MITKSNHYNPKWQWELARHAKELRRKEERGQVFGLIFLMFIGWMLIVALNTL